MHREIVMQHCFLLLFFLSGSLIAIAPVVTPPHMWTRLILTQTWPTTFCTMEHCHSNISYWTLHGLWPDNGQLCNSTWHFNSSQIEDLLPDMKNSWPDLMKPASTGFWKYEWMKHGTCAARASALDSQHKYFSKALELYHKLDLTGVLTKFNIVPSEENYSLKDIEGTLEKFYQVKPKIQCTGKDGLAQTLGQIEICFDSDFTLINCVHSTATAATERKMQASGFTVCERSLPVYYPPLKPNPTE